MESTALPFVYSPIDHHKKQIRLIRFVDAPDPTQAHAVHCTLQNVSINDFTPEFNQFKKDMYSKSFDPWLTVCWHHTYSQGQLKLPKPPPPTISLPTWRRDDDKLHWKELADEIGVNRGALPPLPQKVETLRIQHTSKDAVPGISKNPRDHYPPLDKSETLFETIPRFTWGDFEAVSYCWESEVRDKVIFVDEKRFAVPTNLEAVLQRLRTLPETKTGMKFWVDALCIDQNNLLEKNHQVNMMGEIYKKSIAVVVWLGEEMNDSGKAIDFMTQISHVTKLEAEIKKEYGWEDESQLWSLWVEKSYREWFSKVPWNAICELLKRQYWERLWIIQELALNPNTTLFLCGNRRLSRDIIQKCSEYFEEYGSRIAHAIEAIQGKQLNDSDVYWTANRIKVLLNVSRLNEVLDIGQRAKAKDSRDKVYGLLGLLPEALSNQITPDYALPVGSVYLQMCKAMLADSGKLDSIFAWCFFTGSPFPSWVPNWNTKFPRNHVHWIKRRQASGLSSSTWNISGNGQVLACQGFIVDSIDGISASFSEMVPYSTEMPKAPTDDVVVSNRYGSKQELSMALQRTLIIGHDLSVPQKSVLHAITGKDCDDTMTILGNIYWVNWDAIKTLGEDHERAQGFWQGMELVTSNPHWEDFDRYRQTNANFSIFGYRLRDFFPTLPKYMQSGLFPKPHLTLSDSKNMSLAKISLTARRLVTTKTGYLGLVPEEVSKGDVVAIIYGCNFPVLLRPVDSHYLVIGECYVDGLMDGEAMATKDRGEYKEVEICIH